MKLGTRLLVPLLPTATLIMSIYAGWALIEREQTLAPDVRQETQAYATALTVAFEYALRDVSLENVQENHQSGQPDPCGLRYSGVRLRGRPYPRVRPPSQPGYRALDHSVRGPVGRARRASIVVDSF